MSEAGANTRTVDSDIPGRMDRLPWARWHWLVIAGLGITWILDGFEVTIVGIVAARLTEPVSGLNFTSGQIGFAATIYLVGAGLGALFFSYLTDKFGRKKLFLITLGVYLTASVLTAFAFSFWYFALMRFLAGAGIGGEYSAIYSAIDELMPARVRGQVALAISGSYWMGTMGGAALSVVLLNPAIINQFYGWRLAFLFGGVLGIGVLLIRRYVPESPRWLMTHGRNDQAEEIMEDIEGDVRRETGRRELPPVDEDTITVEQRSSIGFGLIFKAMFLMYPKRSFLGLVLMGSQAFLYNAIFFTFALILSNFYGISGGNIGYFIFPFAVGNLLGPLLLGRYFDKIGRRPMIAGCYFVAGVMMILTAWLFYIGVLTAVTQTLLWVITFFFASSAASAAYLTVSEIFPMEIRAMAIAVFYAIATGLGGAVGPAIFGQLVGEGAQRGNLALAYVGTGVFLFIAVITELILGVRAERQSLESITAPLTAIQKETGAPLDHRPV